MRLRLNKYVVKQYQTDGPLSSLLPQSPLLTSKAKKKEKEKGRRGPTAADMI